MTSIPIRCIRLAAGLLVAPLLVVCTPASAQVAPSQFVQVPEDAGVALSRHLVAIADDPRNVSALKGAGKAALTLGDAQAALGFLARAEEIRPRDGEVKAGIGSALVMLEQGQPALRFFGDAAGLGVAEAEIAGDRGLAFDLTGDPRRAQKDYQTALRRRDNPEVRRRLALSLAISGDRHEALKTIDEQLRRQDRAAWRTRAFILALTGDTAGAVEVVRAVMPGQAAALAPFLARLPTLAPGDRALAVNFGHFPGAGGPNVSAVAPLAATQPPLDPIVNAGRPDARQQQLGVAQGAQSRPVAPAPSTSSTVAPVAAVRMPLPAQSASPAPATSAELLSSGPKPEAAPSLGQSPPVADSLAALSPPTSQASSPLLSPLQNVAVQSPSAAAPAASSPVTIRPPADATAVRQSAPAPVASPPGDVIRLADIAALVGSLPEGETESTVEALQEIPATPPAEEPPAAATVQLAKAEPAVVAKPEPAKAPPAKAPAKPKAAKPTQPEKAKPAPVRNPSRVWVQVAGGADKEGLPREYARLKGLAPRIFAGTSAWTTPLRATNRLLVGPFKDEQEAQAFVNQLNKAKLAGFSWTSPAGQAIEKLPTR